MTSDAFDRPVQRLPLVGGTPGATAARHETVLPAEPEEAALALRHALALPGDTERRQALLEVAAARPSLLEAWSRLSQVALADGEPVPAYAFARVAYHRGLDRLRRHGWGGTGAVRWSQPSNRGFLRGLHALLAAAAALGEEDESARCRAFLLELDPDDALGVAAYPDPPGPDWQAPVLT